MDEAFATRIKQEVVLMSAPADTDHVSKLSRPVWPKSSPTIPSSFFKNDFQTEVLENRYLKRFFKCVLYFVCMY